MLLQWVTLLMLLVHNSFAFPGIVEDTYGRCFMLLVVFTLCDIQGISSLSLNKSGKTSLETELWKRNTNTCPLFQAVYTVYKLVKYPEH